MGHQPPLIVPNEFFGRKPSRPLDKPPFDLTDIQRRVQALSYVMNDICPKDTIFTCQGVDNDFAYSDPICKIVKRAALTFDPVPCDIRCFIISG